LENLLENKGQRKHLRGRSPKSRCCWCSHVSHPHL